MVRSDASFVSLLTNNRAQVLGYQRSLQATDLWRMDTTREAATLSGKLDASWERRVREADEWNARLAAGDVRPGWFKRLKWSVKAIRSGKSGVTYSERRAALETHWREKDGRKEPSLTWALNDVFGWHFWAGGLFKVGVILL